MQRKIVFIAIMSIAVNAFAAAPPPYGKLTVTENLIRQEIIRLGGDWESGAKPAIVSFRGDKFTSRHFEMLTHLPAMKYFHADGCAVDPFALACLTQVRQLDRLDIVNCQLKTTSFSLLRGNRELREILFDSVVIPETLLNELAQLQQLRKITLIECQGITGKQLATLKSALPDVQFEH
ncbi:hypothetical protein V6x_18130 [Gimesia chilikensis]|uniref:Leucine Rich repeats (2 copies) n=1 Tax=Gimesia chilikensis TaxID=2605989 RepID=A0A517WA33_9PLAN|nr:hypothetical protein [Gimesia chilikensis]QDU02112.1 hypothetical protein V6x_18130 [Gimesia chilikensis]